MCVSILFLILFVLPSIISIQHFTSLGQRRIPHTIPNLQVSNSDDQSINLASTPSSFQYQYYHRLKKSTITIASILTAYTLKLHPALSDSAAKGYKAVQSPYAPTASLYSPPLLPQSALLNTLPVENKLIGEIQTYIESFIQLLQPTPAQVVQLAENNSILWSNLRINAQRAAGMFIYNRPVLQLAGASIEKSIKESNEMLNLRQKGLNVSLNTLQNDLLMLVNASRR